MSVMLDTSFGLMLAYKLMKIASIYMRNIISNNVGKVVINA